MALDGITIAAMAKELNDSLSGGRISKIAQPEPDELLLTIKNERKNYRLLISAGASLPLIYLTEANKAAPMTAPNFCMLLRKHISGGRILRVRQPGLERILHFDIEHLNELGDLCEKVLTVEIMGKHSNIIFCTPEGTIIDSIKHISAQVSSVREVLPGRTYFIPETQKKLDPLSAAQDDFVRAISEKPLPLAKAIYTSLTGFSPVMAEELCYRASLDSDQSANSFNEAEYTHLARQFELLMESVREGEFSPRIFYRKRGGLLPRTASGQTDPMDTPGGEPLEFSVLPLGIYQDAPRQEFPTVSSMLETYYSSREAVTRIRQKSSDLRRIVQNALERSRKKYDLQRKQLKDTEKRDKFRVYGELLNTYGYDAAPNADKITVLNYYTNEELTIPLDPTLTARENAQRYFEKYNKQKRTFEALSRQLEETEEELRHLESIETSLGIALAEEDLTEIKEELTQYGYIRRHNTGGKRVKVTSRPFHYISSDGYDMYVGKNNFQNEELTFKVAVGSDWWFHAKGIPGSHVIVKANNTLPPDRTFEEAGRLAAYYSKNRDAGKAEIDYVERKQVKKVNGAKPGFVIYHTNYSMVCEADISGIRQG